MTRGPKIYPEWWHASVYTVGWESSPHTEPGKPRVPFHGWTTNRPWFYGLD